MCEQGLEMRPSWMRLSACSRESQQALAALATLSVSLLAVHAAALQGARPMLQKYEAPPLVTDYRRAETLEKKMW